MKLIFAFFIIIPLFIACVERVRYISVEHPTVVYVNPAYMTDVNFTTKRYGRRNPVYYVGLSFNLKYPFDNKMLVDFYFYEFLSNTYKRSFVEMHYGWCDLIFKDKFFGVAMRQGNLTKPCPHLPGYYNMENMTIPPVSIPKSFPFKKGRIWANLTDRTKNVLIGSGHINMEIRDVKKNSNVTFVDAN